MSSFLGMTGMVTKYGGLPVLDRQRERMGWTRTLVHVNIETGEVHHGPRPGEEVVRGPDPEPVAQVERPNKDRELFLRLVCEARLDQKTAALRAGFSARSSAGLIERAVRDGLIVRVGKGRYELVEECKSA